MVTSVVILAALGLIGGLLIYYPSFYSQHAVQQMIGML
jgi:hypothetical protein